MRFICDANIGTAIAGALSDAGHDVVRAIAVAPDADDKAILAYATANRRILVTCDRDFGELVFLHRAAPPPAIIYIRFEPEDVADIVPRLVPLLDFDQLEGHMTVIGADHDRRTSFPAKSKDHA